ncbi:MAG: hypothetical protein NC918_01945 [Candidatus Omnitrophica bacterium]|nr:hypothetical protein [Candidatus Omnitrophota bacterium]
MRNFCGIIIDSDKTFISFVRQEKGAIKLIDEISLKLNFDYDIINFFKKNAFIISEKINEKSKFYGFKIEKIFLGVAPQFLTIKSVEEIVPLAHLKKITLTDIEIAKKYVEDSVLSWDEFCLHHFVEWYKIEDEKYKLPPIGVVAKKIAISSTIIYLKDKLYQEIDSILADVDLNLGGFLEENISNFSMLPQDFDINATYVVINIRYTNSSFAIFKNGLPRLYKSFSLDLVTIFQELSKKFLIPIETAKNIFEQYFSFKETSHTKEISIKTNSAYINISIGAFSLFLMAFIKSQIELLLNEIRTTLETDDFKILFVGRLNIYEGFIDFLKTFITYDLLLPTISTASSSFGCVRYGLTKFLENYPKKETFLNRILTIYKEYF